MASLSLFTSLNTAVLGMYTQQTALSVVSNNISNANTPGYSRENAVITTTPPLPMTTLTQPNVPISFGTGSEVKSVERIRDSFLDTQYRQSNSQLSFWNEVNTQFQYIQQLFTTSSSDTSSDTSSDGLSSFFDSFWESVQQLATTPDSAASKEGFVQSAQSLMDQVQSVYQSLQKMQTNYSSQIQTDVGSVNSILKQLSGLNVKIRESSVLGNSPNTLLDQRDLLLDNLSKLTNFKTSTMKDGEISLTIGGTNVLAGQNYVPLKFNSDGGTSDSSSVSADNMPVTFSSGEIGSLFNLKDQVVPQYESELNGFAANLADKVNTILEKSYDQNGNQGQALFNVDTVQGQPTALFRVEGSNPPQGSAYDPTKALDTIFTGLPKNISLNINGADVEINTSVDTLNTLVTKINKTNAGVEASLSPTGNLLIRANQSINYDLMRTNTDGGTTNPVNMSDGGSGLFNALGFNVKNGSIDLSSYTNNSQEALNMPLNDAALHISVNSAMLSDSSLVATDFSPVFSNGSSIGIVKPTGSQNSGGIQLIANLKDSNTNDETSFSDFFGSLVSKIGVQGQNASSMYDNTNTLVNQVEQDRQQVSSVSINDEMAKMVLYQNAYTASARVVTTVNSMLSTVVNMVGG